MLSHNKQNAYQQTDITLNQHYIKSTLH